MQMYKKTLRQILSFDSSSTIADITALQLSVTERLSEWTTLSKCKIPAILSMPDVRPGMEFDGIKETTEKLFSGVNPPVQQTIGLDLELMNYLLKN